MPRSPRQTSRTTIAGQSEAEDYSRALLSSAFMLIFCALVGLWSAGGLPLALLGGFGADRLLARIGH